MSKRLDKERQDELEPQRMLYAAKELMALGIQIYIGADGKSFQFKWKGEKCFFWPYSGWHTGKSIKDGRGLHNLLKQLK